MRKWLASLFGGRPSSSAAADGVSTKNKKNRPPPNAVEPILPSSPSWKATSAPKRVTATGTVEQFRAPTSAYVDDVDDAVILWEASKWLMDHRQSEEVSDSEETSDDKSKNNPESSENYEDDNESDRDTPAQPPHLPKNVFDDQDHVETPPIHDSEANDSIANQGKTRIMEKGIAPYEEEKSRTGAVIETKSNGEQGHEGTIKPLTLEYDDLSPGAVATAQQTSTSQEKLLTGRPPADDVENQKMVVDLEENQHDQNSANAQNNQQNAQNNQQSHDDDKDHGDSHRQDGPDVSASITDTRKFKEDDAIVDMENGQQEGHSEQEEEVPHSQNDKEPGSSRIGEDDEPGIKVFLIDKSTEKNEAKYYEQAGKEDSSKVSRTQDKGIISNIDVGDGREECPTTATNQHDDIEATTRIEKSDNKNENNNSATEVTAEQSSGQPIYNKDSSPHFASKEQSGQTNGSFAVEGDPFVANNNDNSNSDLQPECDILDLERVQSGTKGRRHTNRALRTAQSDFTLHITVGSIMVLLAGAAIAIVLIIRLAGD